MVRVRGDNRSAAARSRGRGRGNASTPRGKQPRKVQHKNEPVEIEDRTFVRPNAISPHLTCTICTEVFSFPMRAPCGHTFCKTCIQPWLKDNPTCPIDRKQVIFANLHHDFILENIIGDYTVACPWRSLGCSYIGPLCELSHHKKKVCEYNPDMLPEALRARELQTLVRANSAANLLTQQTYSSYRSIPQPSSSTTISTIPSVPVEVKEEDGGTVVDDSLMTIAVSEEEAEDDELLPAAPPPSLLMRLYQKSDQDERGLLCEFFSDTPTLAPQSTASGNKRWKRHT